MSVQDPSAGRRRASHGALVTALLLLSACDGGPTNPGGQGGPAQLSLAITLQAEAGGGGEGDAYDAANLIHINVTEVGGSVLLDRTAPFAPAAETRVPVAVSIEAETQALLSVSLLRGTSPLFQGTTAIDLVPNDVAPADLELVPVAASIDVPETLEPLHSQGETAELHGNVLFATGDVATSLDLQWTSLTPDVVAVQTDGATSSAVAVGSGSGVLRAAFPPFAQEVRVQVEIVPASVDVEPATADLPLGETLQLTATVLDGLGNPLPGTAVEWASLDEDVASVSAEGLVRGLANGTATIRASAGDATGEATIAVVAPPPTVGTEPASAVRVYAAVLNATVSAKGSPATAWFRHGTDPTLATATETPHEDIGSGDEEQTLAAEIDGLEPATDYYFQAVASNDGGERRGEIESFTTLDLAPPDATTEEPTTVTSTTARLVATVDPRGTETHVFFEWGTDPALASPDVTSEEVVGAGDPETMVAQTIAGLDPGGVRYYARVVATNAAGTTRGEIVSFRTAPPPPSGLVVYYDSDYGYVRMYWASGGSATEIRVERSVVSSTASFVPSQTLPGGATTAYEEPPFPAKTMWYQVRACIGSSCSNPSSVGTITVPDPTIWGILHICFTPGTMDCYEASIPVDVTLGGDASKTTKTDSYGTYLFSSLSAGSYTVRIDDRSCVFTVRDPNEKAVSVGWGESKRVDFYADEEYCGAPPPAPGGPGGSGGRTDGPAPPTSAPGAIVPPDVRRR